MAFGHIFVKLPPVDLQLARVASHFQQRDSKKIQPTESILFYAGL
jgi:hypothetical protein